MLPRSSWGTLLLAYKLVLGPGRPVFVRLMKWPFLALVASVALQLVVSATAEPAAPGVLAVDAGLQAVVLMAQLAAGFVTLPGFTAWMRWVADPAAPVAFRWRRAEWVFLGRVIQVWLFASLLALLAGLLVLFAINLILVSAGGPQIESHLGALATVSALGLIGLVPAAAVAAAAGIVVARYGLSIVAAAVGTPSDLALASNASRPARWHIFWTLVLYVPTALAAMAPVLVAGIVLAIVLANAASSALMASIWVNLILAMLYLPVSLGLYGVLAAVFCLYYRWLVAGDISV